MSHLVLDHPAAVPQLYVFPGGFGQPSLSPFCTKAMAYLTLAGVAHEPKVGNSPSAPLGKLPWLRDGDTQVADSNRIIAHVAERHGADLDAGLDPAQRAKAHLMRRTMEEHLYWAIVHSRWITEAGWAEQRKAVGPMLPALLRPILLPVVRGSVRKGLHGHGLGRHSLADIEQFAVADIEALEASLDEGNRFAFGDRPTTVDTVIYGFIGAAAVMKHENRITAAAKGSPKLMAVVEAVDQRYRELGGVASIG